MIDHKILPLQHRLLTPLAQSLRKSGLTADQVTLFGFMIGVLAFIAIAFGAFTLGLVLILLNRLADGLDGMIAREMGATDRGAYLDIALDFVFYALIPLGFAIAAPAQNALAAATLLASFVGTGTSFLAFATIAAKRGEQALAFPSKGIYYLGGLTEGFETILLFIGFCLFPAFFAPLAYGFAIACTITTLTRWHFAWHQFQAPPLTPTKTQNQNKETQ